jgi:NAD(P)H dehydrogenase (quinone)
MYAITGITGKVGGAVARSLLDANLPVRAVLRDAGKSAGWTERGCDIAVADIDDQAALTNAFRGTEGVFILFPPIFDPAPDFAEARRLATTLRAAIDAARPEKIVCLSTIGAQSHQTSLLSQLGILEQALGDLSMPVAFLRPGWFMENAQWDIAPAREHGVIQSFLQPLDRIIPMVATTDVGRAAADLLRQSWSGRRIVELEGPQRVSPNDIATILTTLLHRPVRAEAVPRDDWTDLFAAQGMKNPTPRMQMLDGFNEGWIDFVGEPIKGTIGIETVLAELVRSSS